ncbi:MAG: PspC domain-containing protein [Thermoflexibacter sp.]|nr:PspC domain-containing protein [Thermoflexibacter sp.]
MKKNISINISGIIFHIEEDGYDKLRNYLSSIHQYFSSYEESEEIIADIENRIAEIFLAKLGQHKQVITAEDVNELIATMGTVDDFEAIEGESKQQKQKTKDYQSDFSFEDDSSSSYQYIKDEPETPPNSGKKILYRDLKRKLIAGVASGIAHYFSIDPLWVRLLFAATFLGAFGAEFIPMIALVSYIALWIMTPISDNLPEDSKVKKLFRNPDKRILGGVASGLASYFGADETVIRLLFVIGIPLGGTGFIIYLILWVITPEAKTLTDKMQMEGEPVTLSNIEKKIKDSLNIDENDEENIFAKILVFPFKIIAKLFNFISENFRPLGNFFLEVVRVLSGSILTMSSFAIVLGLLIFLAVFLGFFSIPSVSSANIDGIPIALIKQSVPVGGVTALLVVLIIPFLTFGIAGVSLIAKRRVVSPIAAWSLFGLWILGLLGASATIPAFVQSFQIEGSHKNITLYKAEAPLITLGLNEQGKGLSFVKLTIRGYEGKEIKLVQKLEARGSSQEEASKNAQSVNYKIENKDNMLIFDKNLSLKSESAFRAQSVSMELFIPYGKEFVMQKELGKILSYTLHPFGYEREDLGDDRKWVFDESGLKCLNCPPKEEIAEAVPQEDDIEDIDEEDFTKEISDLKGFKKIMVDDNFEVEIEGNKDFGIRIEGNKEIVRQVSVVQNEDELILTFDGKSNKLKKLVTDPIKIYISMPYLQALNIKGRSNIYLSEFKGKEMSMILSDYAECKADIAIEKLNVVMKDRSELSLAGKGNDLELIVTDITEIGFCL